MMQKSKRVAHIKECVKIYNLHDLASLGLKTKWFHFFEKTNTNLQKYY